MKKKMDDISGAGWRGVGIGMVFLVFGYVALPIFIFLLTSLFFFNFFIPEELPAGLSAFGMSLWSGSYEDSSWFMILSGLSCAVMLIGVLLIGYGIIKLCRSGGGGY